MCGHTHTYMRARKHVYLYLLTSAHLFYIYILRQLNQFTGLVSISQKEIEINLKCNLWGAQGGEARMVTPFSAVLVTLKFRSDAPGEVWIPPQCFCLDPKAFFGHQLHAWLL